MKGGRGYRLLIIGCWLSGETEPRASASGTDKVNTTSSWTPGIKNHGGASAAGYSEPSSLQHRFPVVFSYEFTHNHSAEAKLLSATG